MSLSPEAEIAASVAVQSILTELHAANGQASILNN